MLQRSFDACCYASMDCHGLFLWTLGLKFEKARNPFQTHPDKRLEAMPPAAKQAQKRPAAAMSRSASPTVPLSPVHVPSPTVTDSPVEIKKVPWNKGQKMSKSDTQHLFIPREDYELFLAVALYFAGPKYVMAFWLTMVTSRRISETLRLHGEDVFLEGGTHHDSPHILFKKRPEEEQYPGVRKLRGSMWLPDWHQMQLQPWNKWWIQI